ncbi:MAG: Gfo/Idh/MocA family oxidoreductase [Bacteroidota bacterium]
MNKLPVGVVGVGRLGSLHAKMYSSIENAQLIGVTDIDNERMRSAAEEFQCSAFQSLDELLSNVKALSIAAATRAHYEIAKKALQRGIHILIEKPITATVEEARELVSLANKHHCKIQVGHIERFNPALLALEKYNLAPMFVESHRLAQFNPRGTDVDVVLDLMIHDIDIIMSLVKSEVGEIRANGISVVSDSIDIANARLQFGNGCVANVTASRISQKKMRKMRMFQKDAYISVDFSDGLAEVFRLLDSNDPQTRSTMMLGEIESGTTKRKIIYEQPEIKEINALKYELESFISVIQNGAEPVVTGADGLKALEVAGRIIEAIKQQSFKL